MNSSRQNLGCEVDVIFVPKRKAKVVKSILEAEGLLEKDFRMIPADPEIAGDCIALPVKDEFRKVEKGTWSDLIQGSGKHFCPYSTAILGKRLNLATCITTKHGNLTLVQQAILQTVQKLSTVNGKSSVDDDVVIGNVKKLELSVCPKKLEVLGDDRTLVVPPLSFEGEDFLSILSGDSKNSPRSCKEELWRNLATIHGSQRIARRGTVDADSKVRESGHRLLYPNSGIPETTGPGSPGWIRVTEQSIKQSFDMTRVMFSRGNISEKIRFGRLVKEGEMVLDMYAGIGYYTLPALIHGRASHVYACEWNQHAANALRYNIKDNHVEDRVTVLVGDCRVSAERNNLVNLFDRISLGLLPSSEGGWRTAVRALKTSGGRLHIHANVPVKERRSWAFWVCDTLHNLVVEEKKRRDFMVICEHVERVKSFAPTVSHYVADIFLGLPGSHPLKLPCPAVGVLDGDLFCPCPRDIQAPSCALSPDGALHQDWMR